jgi:hypothetical protein
MTSRESLEALFQGILKTISTLEDQLMNHKTDDLQQLENEAKVLCETIGQINPAERVHFKPRLENILIHINNLEQHFIKSRHKLFAPSVSTQHAIFAYQKAPKS